jgi:hypothetical protein
MLVIIDIKRILLFILFSVCQHEKLKLQSECLCIPKE